MTLRAQIESDVSSVLLNTDDFAESCTYLPKGGAARTVVAVVNEDSQQIDGPDGLWLVETLHATVSRSSTDGIDSPQLGDGLRREGDESSKGYAYSGDKSEVDQFCWVLQFVRKTPLQRGGNVMPR